MTLLKKIILGLWLTSFMGYLEWGKNSAFVGGIEYTLLFEQAKTSDTFIHPFILFPLLGQVILLVLLLVRQPKFWWTVIAASGIALLFLMLFVVGVLSFNPRITLSVLPFLGCYGVLLFNRKKIIFGTPTNN